MYVQIFFGDNLNGACLIVALNETIRGDRVWIKFELGEEIADLRLS